jgi:hypothetical protein
MEIDMRTLCLLLVLVIASPAIADNVTVRDRNGNPLYHLDPSGGRTTVRDNNGNPHGYYKSTPNGLEFRDNAGNLITRTTK